MLIGSWATTESTQELNWYQLYILSRYQQLFHPILMDHFSPQQLFHPILIDHFSPQSNYGWSHGIKCHPCWWPSVSREYKLIIYADGSCNDKGISKFNVSVYVLSCSCVAGFMQVDINTECIVFVFVISSSLTTSKSVIPQQSQW